MYNMPLSDFQNMHSRSRDSHLKLGNFQLPQVLTSGQKVKKQ